MSRVAFIGDEISAAGYRLAGAAVFSPSAKDVHKTFVEVSGKVDVVMITAEASRHIAEPLMADALAATSPLVMVIEDVRARVSPADLEKQMHAILGLDA